MAAIAALVDSSPDALNTLNELAAALGNDPNFATTMTNALAGKQPKDATLTALAELATSADKLPYFTGADRAALTALTSVGRAILGKTSTQGVLDYLGLGEAAKRDVGTGANQIPDMSSWTKGISTDAIWIRFPDGTIIQMGAGGGSNTEITFPIPFPTQCMIFIAMPRSSASTAFIGTVQEDSLQRSRTGTRVLGFSGVTPVTTAAFGYLAIGR
ncbi:gp53-like domain-containing protein [Escherichia coli]